MKTESISRIVTVEATDLRGYLNRHPFNYVAVYEDSLPVLGGGSLTAIEFPPAIVGQTFAKDSGVSAGDIIEVFIATNNTYAKLTVVAVAMDEGIFRSPSAMSVLTDISSVSGQGLVNAVYLTFSNPSYFSVYEEVFNENFLSISINEGNMISYARGIAQNNTLLLTIGLLFIISAMALIQLTSYLIVARNRSGQTAVFKACGATPKQITFILLLEVFVYGVLGAGAGLALGRLLMHIAITNLMPTAVGIITYPFWKFLLSAVIAIAVSLIACLSTSAYLLQ
jgi:ABC-type antimicrobial peptide transport system permease subunit